MAAVDDSTSRDELIDKHLAELNIEDHELADLLRQVETTDLKLWLAVLSLAKRVDDDEQRGKELASIVAKLIGDPIKDMARRLEQVEAKLEGTNVIQVRPGRFGGGPSSG